MNQHTPGPWKVGRTLWMQDDHVYEKYPNNDLGATIMVEVTEGPGTDEIPIAWAFAEDLPDEYGNARLIAAAPTMLAALEHIRATVPLESKHGRTLDVIIRQAKGESA